MNIVHQKRKEFLQNSGQLYEFPEIPPKVKSVHEHIQSHRINWGMMDGYWYPILQSDKVIPETGCDYKFKFAHDEVSRPGIVELSLKFMINEQSIGKAAM